MENISDKSKQIQLMFDKISPTYDILNRILSLGQDTIWRKTMLLLMPEVPSLDGIHYDIACGTGDVLIGASQIRKDYNHFIGFDLSQGMLNIAQKRCSKLGVKAKFIQATAENLPINNQNIAHCVTIAFGFRNMDNRSAVLNECHRILQPNGFLMILDFFEAQNTFFSRIFRFYFRVILPKIGGLFADEKAYSYLPQSVAAMPSPKGMMQMLIDAGFCSYIEQYSWLSGAVRLFVAKKLS